jgi:LysR family hydrogen peroxide-inducible transcriptional activator
LPSLLREARARFPRLALRIREALTDDLLGALRRGDLDAALVALPVPDEGLATETLFFEPFHLACPIDHPLAAAPTIRVGDLPPGQLLFMEDGHCLRDQTLALCDMRALDPRARFASSLEMLRHMIAAGEGISVLPQMAAHDDSRSSPLVHYRPLVEPDAGRTIALVWRASETRVDDLHAIADFLRASAPEALRLAESGPEKIR